MIYQRLLRYYLDSGEYASCLNLFFELHGHLGECGDQKYRFYSDVFSGISERRRHSRTDFPFRLTDALIQEYFTKLYSDFQLAYVIFGYEVGLSEKQISQIANLNHRRQAGSILDFFLRDPTAERFDPAAPQKELSYYVEVNGVWEEAALVENTHIRLLKTGELLEVLP